MSERRSLLYFCSAEEDSLYAVEQLCKKRRLEGLDVRERQLLAFMEGRMEEATIYLPPPVIFAAANQRNFCNWLERQSEERRKAWYQKGVNWMRARSAFLERFGWKERRFAVTVAGILAGLETEGDPRAREDVCHMLQGGWGFLWRRMRHCSCLTYGDWTDMREPWKDSERMNCAMGGVLLLMAVMQGRQVLERDRLWDDLLRLRAFSEECLSAQRELPECVREPFYPEHDKIVWLLERFRNPQRPAYIREKRRISSEWLDSLFGVMELAGLPAGVCETICLSCREVNQLVDMMGEKMTERQYMTFLMLYSVSRELAQAGRAAAAAQGPVGFSQGPVSAAQGPVSAAEQK
ncbi:MAG: hypothetical protein Q4C65_04035 [Eubacteriales bacterium]|nr:hypothetical protein [Eubacteriales bacterium]